MTATTLLARSASGRLQHAISEGAGIPDGDAGPCTPRTAYRSELEAQALATRRAREAARRCRNEIGSLESEAQAAARAAREDGRVFESLTAELATTRKTEETLTAEKRELCRRIQAAKTALGVKQARDQAVATMATMAAALEAAAAKEADSDLSLTKIRMITACDVTARTHYLRKVLQELGDKNALLSQEAVEEQVRRARVKETVRAELEKHDAERDELNRKVAANNTSIVHLQESLSSCQADERRHKTEAGQLRKQAAEVKVYSPRRGEEREGLLQQLRCLAAADMELRDALQQAQEQLLQQERREQGG